jgi:hypothetical protein
MDLSKILLTIASTIASALTEAAFFGADKGIEKLEELKAEFLADDNSYNDLAIPLFEAVIQLLDALDGVDDVPDA